MSRQFTTMGLNMLSRRSSLLLCVPSKTIVRRLLSNVAQQPVGKSPTQGPRLKVSHNNHRKGSGGGGKSKEEAALAAVNMGKGGMAPSLSAKKSPPPQAVDPLASMKKTNGAEVATEAVGGKKKKQPQQEQQQPKWNNKKQQQQQQQQQTQLGAKPNAVNSKIQQQQQASGGGKQGNAAAKFRQQQSIAAQRGQSVLGVGGVGALSSSSSPSSPSSSSSSSSSSRFANTVTMPDGTRMRGRVFVAGAATAASGNESNSIGGSSSSMMDAAIFERFSNIGERLANSRNGQQQQQQQQRRGGRQQQQQKAQQEQQQRGGLTRNNGRQDLRQKPSPSSTFPPFPPPHHQHPQPNSRVFTGFNFGANSSSSNNNKNNNNNNNNNNSSSNSNSSSSSSSDLFGGGRVGEGRGGRWSLPQVADAGTPTAPLSPPSQVSAPMAEPGQVRMWEIELSNRVTPAPRIPFPSREEHHQQHQQQSRLLLQQQQHRRRGGGAGGGQQQRRSPRLDRRLKALQTMPLVLPREPLSVRDLSQRLSMKMNEVMKRLVSLGGKEEYGEVGPETIVDLDVAELLGLEMGRLVKRVDTKADLVGHWGEREGAKKGWPFRAPVVCVMGHVDHGKTTLLDALRRSRVAQAEAGGITQRLGAFHIASAAGGENGKEGDLGVTVLDTPGHAAFGAMRAHGAQATDIVLLVVSAVDGLQEQTKEIVRLLAEQKEEVEEEGEGEGMAGPSLMVAVTKVDKLGGKEEVDAAMGKIVHALAAEGVMCEGLGGDVQVVPVSAPTGEGLEELMERLQLQAEMLELRASREGPGEGVVLDAYMDRGLGAVTNVLMRWGALSPGDVVVAGTQWGRVKRILGEDQNAGSSNSSEGLEQALPSMPVRLLGLKTLPTPGEALMVVKSEERAQAVVEARMAAKERQRYEEMEETEAMGMEDQIQLAEILEKNLVGGHRSGKKTKAFLALQRGLVDDVLESSPMRKDGGGEEGRREGGRQQVVVPFLVKADGKGTLEALTSALAGYDSDVIKAEVIGMGCGPVTEGDVERAKAAAARACDGGGEACTILAFNVGFVNGEVGEMARREGVSVKRQEVIYTLLDDVKATLQDHMPMERVETSVGRMEVQATFALTGRRKARNTVAGCKVLSGAAFSGSQYRYRVMRKEEGREEGVVVCDESPPATLYHFKEQVQEVKKGSECGLSLDGFGAFEAGDLIECYTVTMKPKQIGEIFRY
ncbi:hypothetical protein VYU27_004923 [Nannochloropsis oceanica]